MVVNKRCHEKIQNQDQLPVQLKGLIKLGNQLPKIFSDPDKHIENYRPSLSHIAFA
jgi:hypothetical protein